MPAVDIRRCPFERRARLYRQYDDILRHHTRFFAAAALINSLLHGLNRPAARWAVKRSALRYLHDTGAYLESLNVMQALHLRSQASAAQPVGAFSAELLDERMVRFEQSAVQRRLEAWALDAPRTHGRVLDHLDNLLNTPLARCMPRTIGRGALPVLHLMSRVREQVGGNLQFARQLHREAIGLALIAAVRSSEEDYSPPRW